jgi:hypothetical protein
MKKISLLLVFSVLISLLFTSCFYGIKGNGKVVKSERQVENFESIDVSAGLELVLIQDSVIKVVVEADENLQEIIKTEVSHGKLKIYPETGIRHASSKKVFVTFKTIGSLHASSGSKVKSKMELKMNSIDISVSSGADIDLAISASKMRVDCNSGANVDLSGSAENLDVDGSSGANIKISDLKSINCNAGASSGANVRVTVTEKLSAKASSGGQIKVSGDPKERDVQKSSGGDVSFR